MEWEKKRAYKQIVITVLAGVLCYLLLIRQDIASEWLEKLFGILAPLLVGGCAALVLNVFVSAIETLLRKLDRKKRMKPKARTVISLIVVIVLLILVFSLIISILIPRISESVTSISQLFNDNKDKIVDLAAQVGLDPEKINEKLSQLDLDNIFDKLTENISNIVGTVVGTVSSFFSWIFVGIMSLVCCVYILSDKEKLQRNCKKVLYAYVKTSVADKLCEIGALFISTFKRFLSCQCLEALILGVMLFVTMLIFRLPYALVISSMTTVFALVPYVGAFVSCAVGALFIVMVSPAKALIFLVVFLVVQQIEGNVVYPRVVGGSIGLPALWTLLAVYIGGELFGIAGMLLCIPIVSVFYTLLRRDTGRRLEKKQIKID